MAKPSDRRAMIFSRIDPDELETYQAVADRHYDGNLSLMIRLAIREFVARLTQQGDDKKGRAA